MAEQKKTGTNVSVSVLVKKGDRILLEKRAHTHGDGTWGPPTGHLDFGEAPEQTAQRETREETGITINEVKFHCVTNDVFEAEHLHYITIWFDAQYAEGELGLNAPEEESEVRWFTWDALPEPLFLPFQNLLNGKTYPGLTTSDKAGAAIEIPADVRESR